MIRGFFNKIAALAKKVFSKPAPVVAKPQPTGTGEEWFTAAEDRDWKAYLRKMARKARIGRQRIGPPVLRGARLERVKKQCAPANLTILCRGLQKSMNPGELTLWRMYRFEREY